MERARTTQAARHRPAGDDRRRLPGYAPARAGEAREQLGTALVERGLLTADQLEWALDAHRRTGERLGRVLLAAGLVHRQTLYWVLAELWGCGFVDLVHSPPAAEVASLWDPEQMALEGWIPVELRGGVLHVATSEPPTRELRRRIHTSCPPDHAHDIVAITFAATTDWDVLAAIRVLFPTSCATRPPTGSLTATRCAPPWAARAAASESPSAWWRRASSGPVCSITRGS